MSGSLPEEATRRLREIVAADPDVEVAAIFGSAARGRLRAESDVDIYLRLQRGVRWSSRRELLLSAELADAVGREVHLILEDEERTSVILRLEVARHGRLLCEARPGAWVELRARAMLAYVDLEPWMARCGEGIRRALAARVEDAHAR